MYLGPSMVQSTLQVVEDVLSCLAFVVPFFGSRPYDLCLLHSRLLVHLASVNRFLGTGSGLIHGDVLPVTSVLLMTITHLLLDLPFKAVKFL